MRQHIIDRRLAGKNKSIGNRERFVRRYGVDMDEAANPVVDAMSIDGRMSMCGQAMFLGAIAPGSRVAHRASRCAMMVLQRSVIRMGTKQTCHPQ